MRYISFYVNIVDLFHRKAEDLFFIIGGGRVVILLCFTSLFRTQHDDFFDDLHLFRLLQWGVLPRNR